MMRVVWEEWRGGSSYSGRVLPLLALGAAAGIPILGMQPGALFLVFVLAALAGGALSGTQRWSPQARDWTGRLSPLSYAAGKTLGLLLLVGAWGLFVLPLFLLVTLLWSVPPSVSAQALVWALAAGVSAQALSHALTWGAGEFQRFVGSIAVFLWTALSLQVPELRSWNALWQVWSLFHDPGQGFDFVSLAALLGSSLALWALIVFVFRFREPRA